jgi:hypothetical protein
LDQTGIQPSETASRFTFDEHTRRELLTALQDGTVGPQSGRISRTIDALEGCVRFYLQTRALIADRGPEREKSEEATRSVLEELRDIEAQAEALRLKVAFSEASEAFLKRMWPEYIRDRSFDTFVAGLIDLQALTVMAQREVRSWLPTSGRPTNKCRKLLEESIAWALVREDYTINTTSKGAEGTLSKVIRIVLDAAGENPPFDTSHIAREVVRKVRTFHAREKKSHQ